MPRRAQTKPSPVDSPPANLESIARSLGIAISTVSRALRDHPGIHPATRLKVQTEAARLGYAVRGRAEAKAAAEGASGRIRHLLTLAQSVSSASQQGYLAGISRSAQAHNIGVFSHHCTPEEAAELFQPGRTPPALRLPDLAGVIFIHRWPEEVVARVAADRPAISIVHRYPGLPVDVVGPDEDMGLRQIVAHLAAEGHKRLGFFGFSPSFSWARTRYGAFVAALTEIGLPFAAEDLITVPDAAAASFLPPDLAAHLPAVRARVRSGVKAWVCSSFVLAQALALALRSVGVEVPGQVSVTGCHGGVRVRQSGILHPTSAETDDEALGAAAVHLLAQRALRAVSSGVSLLLPTHLVQGDTTRATT